MRTPWLIEQATVNDATHVASVLQEAAQWLVDAQQPLWDPSLLSLERTLQDIVEGRFFVARDNGVMVGVMRFDLEDRIYWPEVEDGSSAFVHKLAVRRDWAGKGVSTALLTFAHQRARAIGRQYLRLDCRANRDNLRKVYERFGFILHSIVPVGDFLSARYELAIA